MITVLNERSIKHNSCEDTVLVIEKNNHVLGGIFDGCSTGINSHWTSQTFAYCFENLIKEHHASPVSLSSIDVVGQMMIRIKKNLNLKENQLWSTCILFHYDIRLEILRIRPLGDCFFWINGIEHEISQNNKVDYMGSHLERHDRQDLLEYVKKYPIQTFYNVTNFQIASDGIAQINANQFFNSNLDPFSLLLSPPTSENYLKRMWNRLKNDKFTLNDDLSIVSYARD